MGFSSKHSRWVWWTQGWKLPHVYNEIYCCIFDVVGLYFCWRSWTSCLDTWHHALYQIPTDKNQQVTDSVRNLVMGHVWIFQPYNNPNTNLKNNTKMGHWAQNQASAIMAIPVLWPEPCRRWVRWPEPCRRWVLWPEPCRRWVRWPEPCRRWVRWSEEAPSWSCESEGSGVILDEGMVSDLVSGVLWPEPCRRWVRWSEEKKLWI